MTLGFEWIAFGRDLVSICALTTLLLYLVKLVRPAHDLDRLAYLALAVATPAIVLSALGGLFALGQLVPWALFAGPAIVAFWYAESAFATRLYGLVGALALAIATWLIARCPAVELGEQLYPLLALGGALGATGLACLAAGTALLMLLYTHGSALTSRRTSRFYNVSPLAFAEIGYRLNAWTIPFQGFALAAGALALARHQLGAWPLVAMATALTLQVGYAVWCRPAGYEPGFKPWLLAAILVPLGFALRLLGIC